MKTKSRLVAVIYGAVLIAVIAGCVVIVKNIDWGPPTPNKQLSFDPGRSPDGRYLATCVTKKSDGVDETIVALQPTTGPLPHPVTVVIDFSDPEHPRNNGFAAWEDGHTLNFTTCLDHGDYHVFIKRWRDIDVTHRYMCSD